MKWASTSLIVLPLAVTMLAGCGANAANGPIHNEALGETGVLQFELDADAPLALGMNDLHITVHDVATDAPLTGATVELSAVMPAMAHGGPEGPKIEEISPGMYFAKDVSLPMAGHWELRVQASQTNMLDKATFAYDIH